MDCLKRLLKFVREVPGNLYAAISIPLRRLACFVDGLFAKARKHDGYLVAAESIAEADDLRHCIFHLHEIRLSTVNSIQCDGTSWS